MDALVILNLLRNAILYGDSEELIQIYKDEFEALKKLETQEKSKCKILRKSNESK